MKTKKSCLEDESSTKVEDGFEQDEFEPELLTEDREDKKSSSKYVTQVCHLVQGKQGHAMEDYIVAKTMQVDDSELGLYAIFDGHSGRDVAKYLQKHLFDNILNEPDFWTDTKGAIKRAYKTTDDEVLDSIVGSRGGSTAVTAILVDRKKLVVANVGDSRAVICNDGVAKQISVDHEPQKEQETIESKGGFVSKKQGNVPRVDGQLAMARAFGDGRLKEHITSEPDISVEKIDMDTEFIILASDGLWKVMSNQEAVDCIRDIEDAKEAAECLVQEALDRGSTDDISCIVVIFQ
ncbi:Protein phosphatase 2C (PP2C)-like domain [Macleaya cordata]|uniref:protein-serine/threonine phosphatase n=1 Tax=Macleaya cordata TaxID=56857 RepID=A0A200QRA8_MACCD|nr:Protein phosphatase 2C (PP2C)-like domain [Macleaya cordata]